MSKSLSGISVSSSILALDSGGTSFMSTAAKNMLDDDDAVAGTQGFYIELTLKYPHTAAFVSKLSEGQKKVYSLLYREICNLFTMFKLESEERHFEYYKSGHLHMHALLKFVHNGKPYYPVGVVADIAKKWLSNMPKKYSKYVDSHMYSDWLRYCDNSICVQYRRLDEIERIEKWEKYIRKFSDYNI